VLPDVLRHDGVAAVVSTVPIGPHLGFAVVYYAERADRGGFPAITEWGHPPADGGAAALDEDLGPWITAGRLWWVEPFDPDLELHSGVAACPYLGWA
jgi:hypothetical protein